MPRLLFVTGEYPPDVGGVGDYTAHLRAALEARGWPSGVADRRAVGGRWNARGMLELLRRVPSDGLVHVQFQAAAFDLLGDICLLPGLLRLTRRRVGVVTTFHDVKDPYLFPKAGRLRAAAVRLLAAGSEAAIAADERDLAWLRTRHGHLVPIGSNVACAPPPDYDRAVFRARLGLNGLTLAYFGLLNASKGLEALLQAFEIVADRDPAARLLLLGGSVGASDATDVETAARLRPRVARLGARCVRPGYLAEPELSAHLLAADMAVLPYADGASPRRGSLLACAAHGLPIVSTQPASAAVADAVLAVPAHDAVALAEAVMRVAAEPAAAGRLRAGSRALAERTSWRAIAERHVQIYTELGRG